ncbi:cutinase family protein [Solicola sp. PLA-1-18]|uniref:cutinase family protein n=1 Tax=Solicola sp. PLA-1-18 TaxID=3380532 RepID=UPI003B7E03E1
MRTHLTGLKTLALALAAVAAAVPTTLLAAPASAVPSSDDCASVVVLAARGTGEAAGTGRIGSLAGSIANGSAATVRTQALDYPANLNYIASVNAGSTETREVLEGLAERCPSTRTVLVGWSQGAHALGDALDARGTQLSAAAARNVKAVVFYGDPSFRAAEAFTRGTHTSKNGIFVRPSGDLSGFATRIASYCDTGDRYCQAGDSDVPVHSGYFARYDGEATSFALARL